MKIRYRCKTCFADCELTVRERGKDENVVDFVKDLASIAGMHHYLMKPFCDMQKVDLLMPVNDAGDITGNTVPDSISRVEEGKEQK